MKMPKVSIIVPVYNTEKYLRKCLDSLVNQTLEDIEIVVVDDGSTDDSFFIIDEYRKKHLNKFVVYSQKNSGQAVARNRALELCTGEYIGFLDSDDEAEPQMFEKMYYVAQKCKADLVICDYWFITNKKKQEKKVKEFTDKKSMLIDVFVDPWNKLYRKDILKKNSIKFPEGYFYEDTGWFACTVPFIETSVKINEPLVLHYQRDGSSMTTLDDKRVSHIFPVMDSVLEFYKSKGLYEEYYSELEYFYTKILLCSSMKRISRIQNRVEQEKMILITFGRLEKNFPYYKKNKYFQRRLLGKYIKYISTTNVTYLLNAIRAIKK